MTPTPLKSLTAKLADVFDPRVVRWKPVNPKEGVEKQWIGYDMVKKCFTQQPTLPAWALPKTANKEVA